MLYSGCFLQTQLASQQINSRVEDDTNGIIKDFISEEYLINPSVKMVISNTLYFKGEWNVDCMLGKGDTPAVKSSDMPENFAVAEMFAVRRTIIGDAEEGYFIFGGSFKRPNDDKRGLNLLCGYPLPQAVYDLDDNDETLMEVGGVPVPKFSVSSEVDASTTLRGLGIKLPFSGGELTHMLSPSENLYVFKVLQKTCIDINEHRTEAATATTAIIMSGRPQYLAYAPVEQKRYADAIFHMIPSPDKDYPPYCVARVGLEVNQFV